ncbi:hypothetical protein D499_0E00250 [Hanseniaspora uvarum DSM 2768]|nr:hypothetical protein D499_0E00250 [Hanseniaspora uvarum DSM 2768]
MESHNNNLTSTDINQLKKKILNRSASFKKKTSSEQTEQFKYKNEESEDRNRSNSYNSEDSVNNLQSDGVRNNNGGQKLEESASSNNINMNLQARVLAFHEQRQNLMRSSSIKNPNDNMKNGSNNNSSEDFLQYSNLNKGVNKEKELRSGVHMDNFIPEKRLSINNSSPGTPSIDVVNKPLPPLPTDKKRISSNPNENADQQSTNNISIANKTANHNIKLIEKKMQKMSLLQNRNKNLSSLLQKRKYLMKKLPVLAP